MNATSRLQLLCISKSYVKIDEYTLKRSLYAILFLSQWLLHPWGHHQMETLAALLAFCAGSSTVTGEFPSLRPVTRGFHAFFDLRQNKRLSKQSRRWWIVTPPRSLWRRCNAVELHNTNTRAYESLKHDFTLPVYIMTTNVYIMFPIV